MSAKSAGTSSQAAGGNPDTRTQEVSDEIIEMLLRFESYLHKTPNVDFDGSETDIGRLKDIIVRAVADLLRSGMSLDEANAMFNSGSIHPDYG
jgi:hypothetical protein